MHFLNLLLSKYTDTNPDMKDCKKVEKKQNPGKKRSTQHRHTKQKLGFREWN
jgi:hypothetical protein